MSTPQEKFNIHLKKAKAGNRVAQFWVGVAYYGDGVGKTHYGDKSVVDKDYKQAFEWFQQAANKGHSVAQGFLAIMYEQGLGITKDIKLAFEWRKKAAEKGIVSEQFNLAEMYENGQGVDKNIIVAFEWYEKAATQNHPETQRKLEDKFKLDLEKAKAGNSGAQFQVGIAYYGGIGIKNDDEQGWEWLREAAKNGHVTAQFMLGKMYADGQGVKKNEKLALMWYQKAAEQGNADAQFYLALIYYYSTEVAEDHKLAFNWFRKAAEQGRITSQSILGKMYKDGQGVDKDDKKAFTWFQKAAAQGDAEAQFCVGQMYADGHGADIDFKLACEWIRKAAEQGHVAAQFMLGKMYADGHEVNIDYKQVSKWFRKAAEQGNAEAQSMLKQIFQQCKKSAELGHVTAQFMLGKMYADGQGVEKGDKEAFEWFQKAAEKEHAEAQFHLGQMCERVNMWEQALELYEKAAKQNHLGAKLKLKEAEAISRLQDAAFKIPANKENGTAYRALRCAADQRNSAAQNVLENKKSADNDRVRFEENHIANEPKLKIYRDRFQNEFSNLLKSYCLVNTGNFKREQNRMGTAISILGGLPTPDPVSGALMKALTLALNVKNDQQRNRQTNNVKELLIRRNIDSDSADLARMLTLAKATEIEKAAEQNYQNCSKIKGAFCKIKDAIEKELNGLTTGDKTGVNLTPQDKLAIVDCALLVQKLLNGNTHIQKWDDLPREFFYIVTGEHYQPQTYILDLLEIQRTIKKKPKEDFSRRIEELERQQKASDKLIEELNAKLETSQKGPLRFSTETDQRMLGTNLGQLISLNNQPQSPAMQAREVLAH